MTNKAEDLAAHHAIAAFGLRSRANAGHDSNKTTHRMDQGSENLEGLMARYQAGDFAAASVIIGHISPRLHRFFVAQSLSRADADDLLQETWLRIHKVRHTYRPSQPALPWFYAIARHIRVDHYRKSVRFGAVERQLESMTNEPSPSPNKASEMDELEALLAPLPASQREVIIMLKVEDMSLEEVARATSSTVGSVKQKVHRAYKKLRKTLSAAGSGKRQNGGLR
jgi:RNA polymerase sigma-70 factor, ECF subfamily